MSNLAWDKLKFKTHGKHKFMEKRNAIATKLTKICTQTQKRAFDVAVYMKGLPNAVPTYLADANSFSFQIMIMTNKERAVNKSIIKSNNF